MSAFTTANLIDQIWKHILLDYQTVPENHRPTQQINVVLLRKRWLYPATDVYSLDEMYISRLSNLACQERRIHSAKNDRSQEQAHAVNPSSFTPLTLFHFSI